MLKSVASRDLVRPAHRRGGAGIAHQELIDGGRTIEAKVSQPGTKTGGRKGRLSEDGPPQRRPEGMGQWVCSWR